MTAEKLKFMQLHTRALYTYSINGRITGCNQFNGGLVPRFHLARTHEGSIGVFRSDVPDPVMEAIHQFAQEEPPLDDPCALPVFQRKYMELLSDHGPVKAIWHGPVYRFTNKECANDTNVVAIDSSNRELLAAYSLSCRSWARAAVRGRTVAPPRLPPRLKASLRRSD